MMSIPASFLTEWFETVRIILNAPQRNPPRKSCLAHFWEYIRYGDRSHEYYWIKGNKLDCISMLCHNPMLTWKIIQENSDIEWNYSVLSMHPCITPAIVKEHPDIPWDPLRLSANPSFTYEDIKHLHTFNKRSGLHYLLLNPNITWDHIVEYMSENGIEFADIHDKICPSWFRKPNVCLAFLRRHQAHLTPPRMQHRWYTISAHPNITWDIVQENPDLPWCPEGVSENPNITADILFAHTNYSWKLSKYAFPSISFEDIQRFVQDIRHMWPYPDVLHELSHYRNSLMEVPKNCWDNISFEPNELDSLFCTSPKMMSLHVFRKIRHLHTSLRHISVLSFLRNPLTSAVAEVEAEERKRLRSKCLVELMAIPWLPVDLIRKTVEFL